MPNLLFKPKKLLLTIFLTIFVLFLITACSIEIKTSPYDYSELFNVHFIDVGQGDSIFIKSPGGKTMLIDAGNNGDENTIINYIKRQGIDKLDYVVGTHPHADHIGAMDDIIEYFDIGKVIMPRVTHNTKTYKDVLLAIKNKGLKITEAKGGNSFSMDENTVINILAPNSSSYDSLNNYSVVIRIDYKDTSFLFTGDAEMISEREMLDRDYDLSADVLKVGHHGSNSSTTKEFLNAVSPKYAIICVGKGNSYGHPHKEIMKRLNNNGVKVYTTAEHGDIVVTSDGKSIEIN